MLNRAFITTAMELPGYKVVRSLGVVRGITVRSRSVIGTIGAGLQSLIAFDLLAQHAEQMGANAVIGMRYDANEIAQGVAEVLAYGTAVVVEAAR